MTTTLLKQLQKMGRADLRHVTESSLKSEDSFLFSRSEAADQDLETIYAIAHNGILELEQLEFRPLNCLKKHFSRRA